MTLIVLGSYPVANILGREPVDLDFLATLEDFQKATAPKRPRILDKNHAVVKTEGHIYDCELIWPDSVSEELAELILSDDATHYHARLNAWIPSLNILYMLKMSHRYKKNSPHFLKTMRDIQKMRAAGAFIQSDHFDFFKKRRDATYWYEHPNLNRTKEEFFNPDDSFYVYDHDSIHEAVAIDGAPAYTKYAVEGAEVLSSKQKFFEASHEVRIAGVYEETCVLALERSQIPNDFKRVTPEWSFKKALEKVCTSITSGWFREFAWEHYDEVLELYYKRGEMDYIALFHENKDRLRPYEGEK